MFSIHPPRVMNCLGLFIAVLVLPDVNVFNPPTRVINCLGLFIAVLVLPDVNVELCGS